jgi:A/G-specific adenine glycosylase
LAQNEFSMDLLEWWNSKKRFFPWRIESDPYKLLVAEVLLHRTKAKNVLPIYIQFIKKFPTVKKLSEANYDDIKCLLYGIGLRWRVDMLIETAKIIQSNFDGKIPMGRKLLLSLPGIGDYTASAIRVFCGGLNDPLIDINTTRIISRIYDLKASDSIRKGAKIRNLYSDLRDGADSSKFGFALIDLGSLICLPNGPLCISCPIVKYCKTGQSKTIRKPEAAKSQSGLRAIRYEK